MAKWLRVLVGFIVFALGTVGSTYLLFEQKIGDTQFVTLVLAFVVVGFVLSLLNEIQEFAIAGNMIKFKELREEAEKTIKELKVARTETFRFLLKMAKRSPGGYGDGGPIDSRVEDFWFIYNKIVEFGCEEELKDDIKEVVNKILKGQLRSLCLYSDNLYKKYPNIDDLPSPDVLEKDTLELKSIEVSAKAKRLTVEETREKAEKGLKEYRNLYALRSKHV